MRPMRRKSSSWRPMEKAAGNKAKPLCLGKPLHKTIVIASYFIAIDFFNIYFNRPDTGHNWTYIRCSEDVLDKEELLESNLTFLRVFSISCI